MKYRLSHSTRYQYSEAVSVCHNKLHLAPRALPHQRVTGFHLSVDPEPVALSRHVDYFQNQVDYFAIQQPHRQLVVAATSLIEVLPIERTESFETPPSWEHVAEEVSSQLDETSLPAYQFAFPSRLAPVDARYRDYACVSFTKNRSVLDAGLDLTRRIFEEFQYDPRATTVSTPIDEVFRQRAGVCQDFAHLQVACLRSIGLPARYVSGYLRTLPPEGQERLIGSDESHAWVSLYCGAEIGWVDFDPTNNMIPATDHITIGWGLDYSDLCPIQGVFIGGGTNTLSVSVDVEALEGP